MSDIAALYSRVIREAIVSQPRSMQKRIGPSEIGIECDRRIIYKLAGVSEPRSAFPAWKPVIGTAVHALLERWFDAENPASGECEWLTENRVTVGTAGGVPITGSCDLFHVPSRTVIDHKVVGSKQLQNYRANGPSNQYRVQAHLYARGFSLEGTWGEPKTVAIAFLPRDGELSRMFLWQEPYSAEIADAALVRLEGLDSLWKTVGVKKAVEQSPTCEIRWCPWCPIERAGLSYARTRASVPASHKNTSVPIRSRNERQSHNESF